MWWVGGGEEMTLSLKIDLESTDDKISLKNFKFENFFKIACLCVNSTIFLIKQCLVFFKTQVRSQTNYKITESLLSTEIRDRI